MLADFIERRREAVISAAESLAGSEELFGLPSPPGRHERVSGLVDELTDVLRAGHLEQPTRVPLVPGEAEAVCHERELVRRQVVEDVVRCGEPATPQEMTIVSEWASLPDHQRLQEQNRRLGILLDRIGELAMLLAPDGRILYVNRRAAQFFQEATGLAIDELLGKTGAELGMPSELDAVLSPDELLARARAGVSSEVYAWGRWRAYELGAIDSADGSLGAVTLVVRDIHDPKLVNTRLQLLSKLGALVGSVPYEGVAEALARVPIPELADWCLVHVVEDEQIRETFVAHRDPGKVKLRNTVVRELVGTTRHPLWQEMLSCGFQLLTEVSDDVVRRLSMSEERYRIAAEVGIRSLMVIPVVARGHVASIVTLAYTTESGRRYGRDDPALAEELALHAAHLVENARLLSELRSSEARFRVALASANTAVYEQDGSLRYRWYYNPLVPFTLAGKTHEDFLPPEQAARLTELKRRVLESGARTSEDVDLTLGGERRQYRETVEPVRDRAGDVVGVIGAATDVTDLKCAQQKLSDALAFRDQMTAILGHDLRNGLATVTMAAQALTRSCDLTEETQHRVAVIQRASGRMSEMIETLLDFTRISVLGRLPVSPAPCDLGAVVTDVTEEIRTAAPDRVIEVDLHGDLRGEWDSARMAQVVANLVCNALAYGDPSRSVRVSADAVGADVVVKVHNEGAPISPDVIPTLFEPFRRGPSERSPQGLGLGLYIVKQILRSHGGDVEVDSSPDRGTTFTMRVPRSRQSSVATIGKYRDME
jgi:signal transduction histidine kinase